MLKNNFLHGASTVLQLMPYTKETSLDTSFEENDAVALYNDWKQTGDDIKNAYQVIKYDLKK